MNKILSICVPSYNIEEYIDNCIGTMADDRIIDQIEIIIVNDGSQDATLEKAKKWQNKYPNSIILVDKENGGHGSTINSAIKIAKGKYFKNIDGDDWVDTQAFVEYINKLNELDVDVVFTDFTSIYVNSNKRIIESMYERHNFASNQKFDIVELYRHNSVTAMHALTYRTSILQDNNIRLTENCFYVDVQFYAFPMIYVNTGYYLPINVYQYRLEREGQSVSVEGLIKHYDNHLTVLKSIIDLYSLETDEDYKYYLKRIIKILVNAESEILFEKKAYKNRVFCKSVILQLRKLLKQNNLINSIDLVRTYRYAIKYGYILGINMMPLMVRIKSVCS